MKTLTGTLNESLQAGDQATPKEWNDQDLNEVVGKLIESNNVNGRSFYQLTGKFITTGQLMNLVESYQKTNK